MSDIKLNIYQKLVEVRKTVPYLKKDNKGFQFQYVSSSQTLGALRGAMDKYNLLLIPSVVGHEIQDHTTRKGNHEYFTHLDMEYTWVNADNPEETIKCSWCGQGLDDGEKGIGKAVTYSEKFFLLKFFGIATDKDDPDSFQQKRGPATPPQPPSPEQTANNLLGAINTATDKQNLDSIWNDPRFRSEKSSLSADWQGTLDETYRIKLLQFSEAK